MSAWGQAVLAFVLITVAYLCGMYFGRTDSSDAAPSERTWLEVNKYAMDTKKEVEKYRIDKEHEFNIYLADHDIIKMETKDGDESDPL